MNKLYKSIKDSIITTSNFKKQYSFIQFYIANLKDPHTNLLSLRFYDAFKDTLNNVKILPFWITVIENRAYIYKKFCNENIFIGDEIIKINNMPLNEILANLYYYTPFEKKSSYYESLTFSDANFPYLLWLVYNFQNKFEITISRGQLLYKISIQSKYTLSDDILKLKEYFIINDDTPKILHTEFCENYAIFQISSFDITNYNDSTIKYIEYFFKQISEKKIKNIIIDIRNNLGGDERFAANVLKYLIDTNLTINANLVVRSNVYRNALFSYIKNQRKYHLYLLTPFTPLLGLYNKRKLHVIDPAPFKFKKPDNTNYFYNGKIILLTSAINYSQSDIFIRFCKKIKRCTIVGEQSATNDFDSMSPQFLILPNSKIALNFSFGGVNFHADSIYSANFIPINKSFSNIINSEDTILQFVKMNLIKK